MDIKDNFSEFDSIMKDLQIQVLYNDSKELQASVIAEYDGKNYTLELSDDLPIREYKEKMAYHILMDKSAIYLQVMDDTTVPFSFMDGDNNTPSQITIPSGTYALVEETNTEKNCIFDFGLKNEINGMLPQAYQIDKDYIPLLVENSRRIDITEYQWVHEKIKSLVDDENMDYMEDEPEHDENSFMSCEEVSEEQEFQENEQSLTGEMENTAFVPSEPHPNIVLHIKYISPIVYNGYAYDKDEIRFDSPEQLNNYIEGKVAYDYLDNATRMGENELLVYAENIDTGEHVWENNEIGIMEIVEPKVPEEKQPNFLIFQLKQTPDNTELFYQDYQTATMKSGKIDSSRYNKVFEGNIEELFPNNYADKTILDEACKKINSRQIDCNVNAIGMSDVISINERPYYINDIGYERLWGFLPETRERNDQWHDR